MRISRLKHMHRSIEIAPNSTISITAPGATGYDEPVALLEAKLGEQASVDIVREERCEVPCFGSPRRSAVPNGCKTVVIIGNSIDSRAHADLYLRRYTYEDSLYPGKEGSVVRSVHNPYGDGVNYVVVSGSDLGSVKEAAVECGRIVSDGTVPDPVIRVKTRLLSEEIPADIEKLIDAAVEDILLNGRPSAAIDPILGCGWMYLLSGNPAWVSGWRHGVFSHIDTIIGETDTKPTGRAEFWTWQIIQQWDLLEEAPVFTDSERLELTNMMHELTRRAADISYMKSENLPPGEVRWNHQTFNALGCLTGGAYFTRYYGLPEAAEWLDQATNCFEGMRNATRSWDEAGGYGTLTPLHLLTYGFTPANTEYLESVNLKAMADRAFMHHDPLGTLVNHGDGGGWSKSGDTLALSYTAQFWEAAAALTADGRYRWMIEFIEANRARYDITIADLVRLNRDFTSPAFAYDADPIIPVDQIGLRTCAPLDRKVFEAEFGRSEDATATAGPPNVEQPATVDKIAFRENLDSRAAYLLWDGFGGGRHGHMDTNAIVRLTECGRIWLADGGYNAESTARYHNALVVIRDGRISAMPPLARLISTYELPNGYGAIMEIPDYGGIRWTRWIHRKKNAYFVILDRVESIAPGRYDLRLSWRWLGEVERTNDGLRIEQEGVTAIFAADRPDGVLRDERRYFVGRYPVWDGYPYADPVIRHFEQRQNFEETTELRSGWCSAFSATDESLRVRSNHYGSLIEAGGTRALAGTGGVVVDSFRIDAQAYHIEQGGPILALGATLVTAGAFALESDVPVSAELDPESMSLSLTTLAQAVVTVTGISGLSERTTLALESGDHRYQLASATPISLPASLFTVPIVSQSNRPVTPESLQPVIRLFGSTPIQVSVEEEPSVIRIVGDRVVCGTIKGTISVLTLAGNEVTRMTPGGRVNDVATLVDSTGDTLIISAHDDRMVRAYTADGNPKWHYRCPNGELSTVGRAKIIRICDINNDGLDEILIGTASWWVVCLDSRGTELWKTRCYAHTALALETGKLRDMDLPIILQSNEYYYYHVLHGDGGLAASRYIDRWAPRVFPSILCDIDGDGDDEVICGGSDGSLRAFRLIYGENTARGSHTTHGTEPIWTRVLAGEPTAAIGYKSDQGIIIAVATEGYHITGFSGAGDVEWDFDIGFPASAIHVMQGKILACGSEQVALCHPSDQTVSFFTARTPSTVSVLEDGILALGFKNCEILYGPPGSLSD